MSRTDAAKRAARTRRQKAMIAAAINQARHTTWERLCRRCAKENPHGSVMAFNRWFERAWADALKRGVR
jgi:hypothetical protein